MHAAPRGVCDNLIAALKLLANQQKDGDSHVKVLVEGLQERSQPGRTRQFDERVVRYVEEEVLEKYKIEEKKKDAHEGRGEPLDWRIVKRVENFQPRKWSEYCWTRIYQRFREILLATKQKHAGR